MPAMVSTSTQCELLKPPESSPQIIPERSTDIPNASSTPIPSEDEDENDEVEAMSVDDPDYEPSDSSSLDISDIGSDDDE